MAISHASQDTTPTAGRFGSQWGWLFTMAWRDSRKSRGRLILYMASIILGISALVAISSFGDNLRRDIDAQAAELLGADMAIESRKKPEGAMAALLDSLPGARSREAHFPSMAYFPEQQQYRLAEIKALEGDFPFYGKILTQPESAAKDFLQGRYAILDQSIMIQYGLEVGDTVRIGKVNLTIAGSILDAPGRAGIASSFAPLIYIPLQYLDETGLVRFGSRVEYIDYYRLNAGQDPETIKKSLQVRLKNEGLSIETVEDRKRNIGEAFANLTRFLNLIGFIALLLGCLGVAGAVHIYIKEKIASIAILRCLGLKGAQAIQIFLIQIVFLGLISAFAGVALGLLIQQVLPYILKSFLPFEASTGISWPAIGLGFFTGIVVSLLFALNPLLSVRKVSPLLTLRASYEAPQKGIDPLTVGIYALITLFIAGFAYLQVRRIMETLGFVLAIAVGFAALAGVARLITWSVRRFFPTRWNYLWRQGLANLYRPNNQTLVLMVSIGLGTSMIGTLYFTQGLLLKGIDLSDRQNSPNVMLFDIQTEQKEAIVQLTRSFDLPVMQDFPIVTLRVHTLKGLTAEQTFKDTTQEVPRWFFNNELRVTFRDSLLKTEKILEGAWKSRVTPEDSLIDISLEKDFARRIGVKLGDQIVFNVQGAYVATRVGSLREMKFDRMNLLILFPAGVLEKAPQFHLLTTRAPSPVAAANYQRALVRDFPTVSVIDLGQILDTIEEVFQKISFVIRFMAMFSIITGLLVLVGSVVTSKYQRIREGVLLRTLGADRKQILAINAIEYLMLGFFAALTGVVLSLLFTWSLATFAFKTTFVPDFLPVLLLLLSVALLSVGLGMINIRGILDKTPLEVLRKEEE